MTSLGEKVKKLRKSAGLNQEQLAQRLDINVKSIQRYESGKSRPDTHSLIMLATFFDVSTDYLLGLIGIKDQMMEERNKILQQGQYNILYKNYLNCKNYALIDENATYYWIYFGDQGDFGGQTEWVGWADIAKRLEIRRLRPVKPHAVIEMCTTIYKKPMLINDREAAEVFRVFGGQAIVKAEICENYLPEFYEDYISYSPENYIFA